MQVRVWLSYDAGWTSFVISFYLYSIGILVYFQCLIPFYLVLVRLQSFGRYLQCSNDEFKKVHVMVFELFEIIELSSNTFGLQLFLLYLPLCLNGSLTIFVIFETFILKDSKFRDAAGLFSLDNSSEYIGILIILFAITLVSREA